MHTRLAPLFGTAFFFFIACSIITTAQEKDWIQLPGPTGGSMQSFAAVDDAIIAAPRLGAYFRSTDEGRSWQLLLEEKWTRNTIALHTTSEDILFALSTRDVFRSSDGGETWLPCEIGEIALYIASATDGTVLLGLRGAVAVSTDQGASWERSYPVPGGNRDFKVAVDDTGNWYAGAYQTGLFRSTDRGATWEAIDDALPNDVVYSVSVPDGDMLYVGLNNATFRSSDQGETWEELPDLALRNVYSVHYAGAATLLAETSEGPFISHDGGTTWQEDVFEPFENVSGLWVRSDGLLLFSANGRIQRSDDRGRTYEVSDAGLFVQNIAHIEMARVRYDSVLVMVGTGNDGAYVSWDDSDRWEHATPGYWNYGVREIHFTEHSEFPDHESTVAILTEDGDILRSSDLWAHWELVADSLEAGPFLSITAAEPLYALTTDGEVLYHEKETGWERRGRIQPGSGGIGDATLQKSGNHLLAATDRGPYLSKDGGVTWELLLVDGLPRYFVEAKVPRIRYWWNCFAATTTELYLSVDYFQTWTRVPHSFTAPRFLGYQMVGELVFADMNDIKIIAPRSPEKITPFSIFPYEGLTTLGILYRAVPLAGTASRGIYKSLHSTVSVPETPPAPALFELSELYPVPLHTIAGSGADVHLRLQLRTSGSVVTEVCDLMGRVLQRHDYELQPGESTLRLSVPDAAASMLLLRVHGPGGTVQRLLPVLSSR